MIWYAQAGLLLYWDELKRGHGQAEVEIFSLSIPRGIEDELWWYGKLVVELLSFFLGGLIQTQGVVLLLHHGMATDTSDTRPRIERGSTSLEIARVSGPLALQRWSLAAILRCLDK